MRLGGLRPQSLEDLTRLVLSVKYLVPAPPRQAALHRVMPNLRINRQENSMNTSTTNVSVILELEWRAKRPYLVEVDN